MLLMKEQRDGQISNLLLRVFTGGYQVDGLQMPEIDIVALYVNIQELADVFLLLVPVQASLFKLLPYIGQFFIDSLFFEFPRTRIPQVGDELNEATHGRHCGYSLNDSPFAVGARRTEQSFRQRSFHTFGSSQHQETPAGTSTR